ncbi:MAG: radical SAM protein [Actinobacteria bacterium]|nr:radical SAM protein [Actinomycetota bacterium]
MKLSFYIHIPYCIKRCGYCDFNTYTPAELGQGEVARSEISSRYMAAVAQEILRAADQFDSSQMPEVPTIFFGGGTPSLMDPHDIAATIEKIDEVFSLSEQCEITLEANPDTLDERNVAGFAAAGINRISLGVQSANQKVLATLDRTHKSSNVTRALELAASNGIQARSIDLIYGTPGESIADLEESLDFALSLPIDHISAYALIVESGTRLATISYMNALKEKSTIIAGEETLDESAKHDERIMLGIRLREGIARSELSTKQEEIVSKYLLSMDVDERAWSEGRLTLTLSGRLIADRIVRDLVL